MVFRSDHRLAAQEAVDLPDIVGETLIIPYNRAPTLRSLVAGYLEDPASTSSRRTKWWVWPTPCRRWPRPAP